MPASEPLIAREEPPFGLSREQAVMAVQDVLGSIGDTYPECPPEGEG
jgi:hypothetical protein